jgi:DNA-binding transcriptional MerR regulator
MLVASFREVAAMYTVTRLARAAGTSADAVRHYTELGLLAPVRDRSNNYRHYDEGQLARLQFVRTSRELGFSLDDIRSILADADRGDSPCPNVRELYQRRLAEVEAEIARLQAQRRRMRGLLQGWEALPDCVPSGRTLCHLIDQARAGSQCHD